MIQKCIDIEFLIVFYKNKTSYDIKESLTETFFFFGFCWRFVGLVFMRLMILLLRPMLSKKKRTVQNSGLYLFGLYPPMLSKKNVQSRVLDCTFFALYRKNDTDQPSWSVSFLAGLYHFFLIQTRSFFISLIFGFAETIFNCFLVMRSFSCFSFKFLFFLSLDGIK